MRRYLLHLSYLGTRYRGFQKQNLDGNPCFEDAHTICGLLEIGLKGCEPTNHPIIFPSSRTDKGVHALCNTVHVDLDGDRRKICAENVVTHLNKFFEFNDHDIRVLKVQQVAEDFHCRFKAYERRYLYRFAVPNSDIPFHHRFKDPCPVTELNRCYFPQNSVFDAEAVKSSCKIFVGKKDFAALRSKNNNPHQSTTREILSLELEKSTPFIPNRQLTPYQFWQFTCSGKSFLYHQVRRTASVLIAHGQGRVTLSDLQRLFEKPVEESWNQLNISLAPAHGLYLLDVLYRPEDLEFVPDSTEEDQRLDDLKREELEIENKLNYVQGAVLEKINLKQRLLEIKKCLNRK